jgi:diguanylate cyclase (GGDEF)-like protein/PAS domain S-box-containing protein
MRKLPLAAQALLALTVAVGFGLMATMARLPQVGGRELWGFWILTLAAVGTSAIKLHLPTTRSKATMSASFVIDFASLLLYGPESTILVAAAGAISQMNIGSRRPNPLHRTLFNVASFVITIAVTGWMYRALGGSVGNLSLPADVTPLAAATTTYFLVNSGLVALIVSLSTRKNVLLVWRHNFLWSGPNYFIGAGVAATLTEAIAHEMWGFLPVVAIPVYLTYRAYRVYAGRLEEEHRHREIIESLNEGMAVVDRDGFVRLWNEPLKRITDIGCEQAEGRRLLDVMPALSGTALPAAIDMALLSHEPRVLDQFEFPRAADRRVLQLRIFPFVGGVTVFWNDVTDHAEAELALKRSEERYALAASGANDGLWDWDLNAGTIHFSARWRGMIGLPAVAGTGHPDEWLNRVHPDDRPGLEAALDAHIRGETEHYMYEHQLLHTDGAYRWMLCKGAAVRPPDGTLIATRLAGSLTDVTERVRAQEHMQRAAQHDALTDLPNRKLFVTLLADALDRSRRHADRPCAVLFLDIDRFKIINDSLGHQIGDELLVAISRRLQGCVREGDVVARLGGDEFTILLTDLHSVERARVVAQRILDSIQAPLSLGGREIFTSTSIGMAISTPDYTTPDEIMRDADSAMYRAKTRGKARYEIFDAEMHAQAVDRLGLENDLRRAVERREMSLNYQPIVSLASGQAVGLEALLRWNRSGVPVSPTTFIPVAEEIGVIEALGAWVVQEACRQFASWQETLGEDAVAGITVNVSTRQLVQPSFVSVVQAAVIDARMNPSALRLEITETALMKNPEIVEDVLRQLRAFGVKIYLDDFGTGYSSLSHLHNLPVDALKIDRSFVASLMYRDRPAIVESILALARTLNTPVIAEGVETAEQLQELTRLGCTQGQGFLFARPLAPADAQIYMSSGGMWSGSATTIASAIEAATVPETRDAVLFEPASTAPTRVVH